MKWSVIVVLAIVVLLIVFCVSCYNKLIKQKILVDEAFATMDVYLKKRFDLIPNLVETVKGYARHEEETLTKMVNLRSGNYSSMTPEQKMENSAEISRQIPKIMALAEAYPDLKSNQNFMELSAQLERMEEDIANARKYYNGAVRNYNVTVQTIPTNFFAGMLHYEIKPMYEVENDQERENIQVKF